uniref:Uncharacterized protein n=1 Tax=Tanacetum cinerariifolium TaxID=118510 RepID=A0A699GEB8_TANCI|nr:hypothetical protein [Tanacetum cinerariifolium]
MAAGRRPSRRTSGLQEGQQVGVELVLVGGGQAVRRAFVHHQLGVLQQLGRGAARRVDRHDLVVVAVHHQHRHVDFFQVGREVGFRELLDAVVRVLDAALHALGPERVAHAFGYIGAGTVVAVERQRQVLEKLRAVGQHALADAVEHGQRQAVRVGVGLDHLRRHRRDQRGLLDAAGAVAGDVARHFAAAGGVAHQRGVADVERVEQRGQVVGVRIHVVAGPWLAGLAMTAAVMGDHAVAFAGQEDHLVFPGVALQRPAVAEHHGGAGAPVLEVDAGAVFGDNAVDCEFAVCHVKLLVCGGILLMQCSQHTTRFVERIVFVLGSRILLGWWVGRLDGGLFHDGPFWCGGLIDGTGRAVVVERQPVVRAGGFSGLADAAQAGEGDVRCANQCMLVRQRLQQPCAGGGGVRFAAVVLHGRFRMLELDRGHVHDVAPDQQLLAAALHAVHGVAGRVAGRRQRVDPRFQLAELPIRFVALGGLVRRHGGPGGVEKRGQEIGRAGLVGGREPVIGLGLRQAQHGVGKRGLTLRHDAARVVLVQVGEQHFVDLFRPVAGSAQVGHQLVAACAVQHAGTGIDQDQLFAGVDQERVDGALHGRGQVGPVEVLRDGLGRDMGHHGVDGKGMAAVGQRGDFEVAQHGAVVAGRLGLDHGRGGLAGHRRQQRARRQQWQQQ